MQAFPATGGESFGIVLLEAMASRAGVVIGGNNPGYASVLAPWPETIIDPYDTISFATQLERLLLNNSKRMQIHGLQQQAVKSYDVAVVGPRLVIAYQNAIAKRNPKKDNIAK